MATAIANTERTSSTNLSLERLLSSADDLLERFAPLLALIITICFCGWVGLNSNALRLRYDELLEIQAATAPTVQQVLSYLASGVDYNPPLSHGLIRTSIALFGTADWVTRLPSFFGVLVCLACLYKLLSKWLSPKYGLLAILLIICSPVRMHAGEARPYGLVLGLTGIALLLYQHIAKPGRSKLALIAFAAINACLVASHYYAVLVASPFLIAEGVRRWSSKRWDLPLLACIMVPPVLVLALLSRTIRSQRLQLTHYFSRGNFLSFNHGYEVVEVDALVYGLAITFIAVAAIAVLSKRELSARFSLPAIGSPGLILGIGFLLLPLEGAVCTQLVTHAYVSRYFLPAAIGFAICVCYLVDALSRIIPGTVVAVIVALTIGFGNIMVQQLSHPPNHSLPGAPLQGLQAPIVFDSPEDYLRILHYQPELKPNMLVIADPAASMRSRQYDTDDKIMLALASQGRIETTTLSDAARRWSHFSLLPRPQEYGAALQCLIQAGGRVTLARDFQPSNFLFDVTVSPDSIARIDTCSSVTR